MSCTINLLQNERYQPTTEWSTPYRSRLDTSMVTNALYEPNILQMPDIDAANRHTSVASERLYICFCSCPPNNHVP